MVPSDSLGYSESIIDWDNKDSAGNITFKHQVSESFLRNYILLYNYRTTQSNTSSTYQEMSYYIKRYVRAMGHDDSMTYSRTKNNILSVNGNGKIGVSPTKWDRIEKIHLKYSVPTNYATMDNQALLDYIEISTIYEEQSQLVCNLIIEMLAKVQENTKEHEGMNSWENPEGGFGSALDAWIDFTFKKWSSDGGHIEWTDTPLGFGWDEFADIINQAPEPIHSFVNLMFSIVKLSIFSVLFPPVSALMLISFSYDMLSLKSVSVKAKSFNLLMVDLLDLYLSKEGYQVKTFENEIKRHENESTKIKYEVYDTEVGASGFPLFDYAWKVSPLTFPHKPFQYSGYEVIFGFDGLYDLKNKINHRGLIKGETMRYGGRTNLIEGGEVISNKNKYWKHINTQLISLFELIGKRNQKPVLSIPNADGTVRIYHWDEHDLHDTAGFEPPISGDWRWAGYEIKLDSDEGDSSNGGYGYTSKSRTKRIPKWNAEDDGKTYNTNPEINFTLTHKDIKAFQYDLIRYSPNALQRWRTTELNAHSIYFQDSTTSRTVASVYMEEDVYALPLLVIGNEYLTLDTEQSSEELLKYLTTYMGQLGKSEALIYAGLDENNERMIRYNRGEDFQHNKAIHKILEFENLDAWSKSKIISHAIGKGNSILNISTYDMDLMNLAIRGGGGRDNFNITIQDALKNYNPISIEGEDMVLGKILYSARKSLAIARDIDSVANAELADWSNMFYPNSRVINVLGRKPTGFINWYVNPTLEVMAQDDYGKSDSTETKQDEPPSKKEVKLPLTFIDPDDELIVEGDDDNDDDGQEVVRPRGQVRDAVRDRAFLSWGEGWRRDGPIRNNEGRNNSDEN
tara:strand:- start:522 stop:3077 length:2556 start_codon:yes stop_codon:yes gene_type:complete